MQAIKWTVGALGYGPPHECCPDMVNLDNQVKSENIESEACHAGFTGHLVDLHMPRGFSNHCHFAINSLVAAICVWVEEICSSEYGHALYTSLLDTFSWRFQWATLPGGHSLSYGFPSDLRKWKGDHRCCWAMLKWGRSGGKWYL